jgi:hypothetical protein
VLSSPPKLHQSGDGEAAPVQQRCTRHDEANARLSQFGNSAEFYGNFYLLWNFNQLLTFQTYQNSLNTFIKNIG